MKTRKKLLILSLIFLTFNLYAQTEDLTKDKAFFKEQTEIYQKWLNHSGLGRVLKVQDIVVTREELSLYLSFSFVDTDSVTMAWRQLKREFEQQSPLTLEQKLFYQMSQVMDIRQSVGNVQLYDTYDLRVEPCFFRGIYFKEEGLKIDSSGCKSKIDTMTFEPIDFNHLQKVSATGIQKKFPRQTVFDNIYDYAVKRFGQSACQQRKPEIRRLESRDVLRFEVVDLCKEVLIDEENSPWCFIIEKLGRPCNWVKRERLTFTFVHNQTPKGITISCEIDGKIGPGFFSDIPRTAYIDMEVDFDEYLENYAQSFTDEIRRKLLGLP